MAEEEIGSRALFVGSSARPEVRNTRQSYWDQSKYRILEVCVRGSNVHHHLVDEVGAEQCLTTD